MPYIVCTAFTMRMFRWSFVTLILLEVECAFVPFWLKQSIVENFQALVELSTPATLDLQAASTTLRRTVCGRGGL